jgi:hypothetical protein
MIPDDVLKSLSSKQMPRFPFQINEKEQSKGAQMIMLLACIGDVSGSNRVRDSGYTEVFRGFPQSLKQ